MPATTNSPGSELPLHERHCQTPAAGGTALSAAEADRWLRHLPHWNLDGDSRTIQRSFRFSDFHHTMAFVNALAWVAHQEDHHPDLEVGYNRCTVRYHTHAVNGLSLNDFICAAKIDALLSAPQ